VVEEAMPLLRIDAVEGRSEVEIRKLLDATQRTVLTAFHVPQRDRYQIYHAHPQAHLVAEDTGLGITRTKNLVVVSMVSRERTPEMKQKFYAELCRELKESCGIEANDVIVSIVSNSAADWSFGNGRAQFVTGEL
jgi:Tautomerase enzyme